ncbi:hypothetical protein ACFXGA_38710 [Actinosynnema sp. NPDC059335]|uniref:hypothetical protein n=1 Tax=Actinosynnema sp. NPDC059335 TaxID=3346804 RepID=UPI003670573D
MTRTGETRRPIRRRPTMRAAALALCAAVMGLGSALAAPAAQAAGTGYNNTDPYATGCNVGASPIHYYYPPGGGRFTMFYSGNCGTNWIQWDGPNVCTWKRVQSAYGSWTKWESDHATWSYSMQIYAPGTTSVDVEWAVGSTEFGGGRCFAGAWDYAHEVGKHGWYTV